MVLRVLITGASRGFGAALARSFARGGALVFAGVRVQPPSPPPAHGAGRLVPVVLDVTSDGSLAEALSAVRQHGAALDVLVNNAAIYRPTTAGSIEQLDLAAASETLDVNALGPLRVVQAFLPLLRAGDAPLLMNVSSEAGSIGQCWRDREFPYCMSKAALNMATALLANYLRGEVRVLSLHPGWLRTDMGGAEATLEPEEAADAVVRLALRERARLDGPLFLDHLGQALAW